MANWIGYMVSISCNDNKGIFQGEIQSATNTKIVLTKPFRDGIPCGTPTVSILASDIKQLKLIDKQTSAAVQAKSTITIAKPIAKRAGRTQSLSESTNVTNKVQQPTNINNNNANRSKPIEIQQNVERQSNSNAGESQGGSYKNSTPFKKDKSKQKWGKSWKDEAAFGSPLDQSYSKDFDFEKNLALFDKQAIWDEINNSTKPDVVKHTTDQLRRQVPKYRHDENVIATTPPIYRPITVTSVTNSNVSPLGHTSPLDAVSSSSGSEYVTDDGLVLPAVTAETRHAVCQAAERAGLTWERRAELIGRAAAEMALQLLGGAHRLNPRNWHQRPRVVFLCGANRQGATAINAARQLSSHGVHTTVFLSPTNTFNTTYNDQPHSAQITRELALYRLTRNPVVTTSSQLTTTTQVDLIILAICEDDHNQTYNDDDDIITLNPSSSGNPVVIDGEMLAWVSSSRAPILALDPPRLGTPDIPAKFSLVPVLPLRYGPDCGKVYLCNVGVPVAVFGEVGIGYKSPFGAKFVIPLYPSET